MLLSQEATLTVRTNSNREAAYLNGVTLNLTGLTIAKDLYYFKTFHFMGAVHHQPAGTRRGAFIGD